MANDLLSLRISLPKLAGNDYFFAKSILGVKKRATNLGPSALGSVTRFGALPIEIPKLNVVV